jgi:signal transduction histidine kinase
MALSGLIFAADPVCAQTGPLNQDLVPAPLPTITNLSQFRQLGLQNPCLSHPIRLEGQVCWVNPAEKTFALVDATGGLLLQWEWLNQPLSLGQRVRLTGAATVLKGGNIFKIGVDGLVMNNDGLHPMIEQAGATYLKVGKVPIRLDWFNGEGLFGLTANFEGPGLPRQGIKDSALFRKPGNAANWVPGLDYRCYEGWWHDLPDFDELKPVKTGVVDNFNLGVRTRDEGVGLQFEGFLDVPRDGIYTFHVSSDDGSRLSIGQPNLQMESLGPGELPVPHHIFIGQLMDEAEDGSWSQIEGRVTRIWPKPDGLEMELGVGAARMEVQVNNATNWSRTALMDQLIRATGFCAGGYNSDGLKVPNLLLVPDSRLIELIALSGDTAGTSTIPAAMPVLTKAAEVHELKRKKAELSYPVKVRGVVTSVDSGPPGFTLQDLTGGVYVQGADPVRLGDFVEVEGVTDPGVFAPMLRPSRIQQLGEGRLPEPIVPTWDQLMNGSLDAQYVEIEGIVTTGAMGNMQFLTHGGAITVELINGLYPMDMKQYENTLIRVRGVLFADWNPDTHQVKLGEIRLFDPKVTVENPTPVDMLSAPYKTPMELMQFDPQASLFQRIRMSGQIVYVGEAVCFMMAGDSGVRFMPKVSPEFKVGDLVEVVGFPQLGGAAPLLREAVVRKTGNAALPEARGLPPGNLSAAQFDATRVSAEGVLTGTREETGPQTVLEMQDGAQNFVARLDGGNDFLRSLPIGSRLELTGVYAFEGGHQIWDRYLGSFELLLGSPMDVKVLARPPWWTLRRLLVMVGILVCILVVAVLWISQLHRKVEERTVQLEEQIQKRQSIEQHRVMEHERARIAQDLHDELGSGLTEIGMLAALPVGTAAPASRPLDQIGDRARHMVTALDEIVWAMNPKHDSLESLGSYLCLYADRFLKLANITCRLRGTLELPGQTLNPIHRHEFFLAFKEALTNIVRHSGATEVRLSIRIIGNRLRLSLTDNGSGLRSTHPTPEMDGLANMRKRLEKMGGRFAIAGQAGRGTILRFYLPLNVSL